MNHKTRRRFLQFLLGLGFWRPAWGRVQPQPSSKPSTYPAALAEALNGASWAESSEILLEIPPQAENGAIVPITVESRLPNTARLFVFAEHNPGPLLARFDFEPGTEAWVSLRVKLNESGPVLAVAESEGRFYGAVRQVRVMVGGCG